MPANPEDFGFLRTATIAPELRVADVGFNTTKILQAWQDAAQQGARIAVFPELALTGYTCADLFFDRTLRNAAWNALRQLRDASATLPCAAIIGLPVELQGRLFNVAAAVANGEILGLVPKTHLPNYVEFYEQRWFAAAKDLLTDSIECDGEMIPVGTDLIFRFEQFEHLSLGIEICEDLWATEPPSGKLALAGATVIANPSASDELLGKVDYRRSLIKQQSARCLAAYLYASAGPGESSTDVVYSGHCLAVENGHVVAEGDRFDFSTNTTFADIDLEHCAQERLRNTTFTGTPVENAYRVIAVSLPLIESVPGNALLRKVNAHPFVPSDQRRRAERCREIFAIQATGLAKRLRHTNAKRLVLGISGGLDSTLALLVAVHAFDRLSLKRSGILAVTMPGFGTTGRTKSNASELAKVLGVELRTISIDAAARQHFVDIGHDESNHDVVYENTQARERTQILMNLANQVGGFVLGTGDLSEAALGWMTYAGDHISMYHVNIGVPKTLVRYLVDWCADEVFAETAQALLHDIAATPITPELLPLSDEGELQQMTEDSVGPYELHDFFLFQMVRFGYGPSKILFLAENAFASGYDRETVKHWLTVFYRRFFSQQFKRSCCPDGPKVGTVALSPRGDWRMPSDAMATLWLEEISAWGS
ncbi:MAG: NAD(+) synthase [Verrucomicrobiota bacterium]